MMRAKTKQPNKDVTSCLTEGHTTRPLIVAALATIPLITLCAIPAIGQQTLIATSQPNDYRQSLGSGGVVTVTRGQLEADYRPEFTVIRSDQDPALKLADPYTDPRDLKQDVTPEGYQIPRWHRAGSKDWTDNVFEAGTVTRVLARSASAVGRRVLWSFRNHPDFTLSASIGPVESDGQPSITYTFTANRAGWYTVGYTGSPAVRPEAADGFYQPLIWQEKRFPRAPLMTIEAMGGLPATFVTKGGATTGLAVDPDESPFRLPTITDSRFGVMLRNQMGEAQPMAFAPLLGQSRSKFAIGQSSTFTVRPVITRGDWFAAFSETASGLYSFRDYRENVDTSLNKTIDNIIEFAMNDAYSGWDADLKGFNYFTDVPGTVKVVSALHPVSIALLRDDVEIYRRRGLPVTEYLLSRSKYLYSTSPGLDGQNASNEVKGPSAEVAELAALYAFSHQRSPIFAHYAKIFANKPRTLNLLMVSEADTFWNHLALYRMGGDLKELARARQLADAYVATRIDRPQTDFTDVNLKEGGQFWTDFTPRWVELFELWEETREQRYLRAAAQGARLYASFSWYYPRIPAGTVEVDKGGRAPLGGYEALRKTQMETPAVTLPAWQVSQIGLTPEASTTWEINPAVMLTSFAPYLLRVGAATNDAFLQATARSAVVGRYANYPGYDINRAFSAIQMRADYPLRPYADFSYNQIYYNHVWPQIAMLVDFLVSDFDSRSKGAIHFPSEFVPGYAYLKSKVYGDRPGEFLGDHDVRLWMPKDVIQVDDAQVNHLTGYGNGKVYLALANQATREVVTKVRLNHEYILLPTAGPVRARVWRDGRWMGFANVRDGTIEIPVSAKGLTAVVLDNTKVFSRLQSRYFAATSAVRSNDSFREDDTPFGRVTAMLLSLGDLDQDAYVWLSANDRQIREARLVIEEPGGKTMTDSRQPFEFTVPRPGPGGKLRYRVEVTDAEGKVQTDKTREISN